MSYVKEEPTLDTFNRRFRTKCCKVGVERDKKFNLRCKHCKRLRTQEDIEDRPDPQPKPESKKKPQKTNMDVFP